MTKRETAEYVLDRLQKAGVQEAACTVSDGRTDEMNIAAGELSLMRTTFDAWLSIKVLKDHKLGTISVNRFDKDTVDRATEECVALAETAAPDENEGIAEKAENKSFVQGIFSPDMDGLYNSLSDFMAEVKSKYPTVILEDGRGAYQSDDSVFVNTNGVCFESQKGYYNYSILFSAKEGGASSSFNHTGARFENFNTPIIELGDAREILADAQKHIHPKTLPQKYVGKIILTPDCFDDFLDGIDGCYTADGPLIEGTSIWKDALGTQVADKRLTVSFAPLHPLMVCAERVTTDGYESRDYDWIKDGVLSSFTLSRYAAKKTGKPRALNSASCRVAMPGEKTLERIIAETDCGVLVGRFSGGMPGPSGDFSGVAKNSFLIEKGRVTDSLSETMISGNYAAMLKNLVDLSSERCVNGSQLLPWACFDGITVSSN